MHHHQQKVPGKVCKNDDLRNANNGYLACQSWQSQGHKDDKNDVLKMSFDA